MKSRNVIRFALFLILFTGILSPFIINTGRDEASSDNEYCCLPTALAKESPKALEVCLSPEEMKLYQLLNEYRATKGLPAVPLSASLTYVAQSHAKDLEINQPNSESRCNMHSWSDDGEWSSCCYTSDHKQAKCMWDKPKEMTNYEGIGFEISFGGSGTYEATAEDAIKSWKGSGGHNAVMINSGIWKDYEWQAAGIGLFGSYGVIWFGRAKDVEPVPEQCKKADE